MLTTGARIANYFGSEGRKSAMLRKDHPDPLVEIHPDAAAAGKINDGDWVMISSPHGEAKFKARLTDGIDACVVAADFGWWFPERSAPDFGWRESSINMLNEPAWARHPWRAFNARFVNFEGKSANLNSRSGNTE